MTRGTYNTEYKLQAEWRFGCLLFFSWRDPLFKGAAKGTAGWRFCQ